MSEKIQETRERNPSARKKSSEFLYADSRERERMFRGATNAERRGCAGEAGMRQ